MKKIRRGMFETNSSSTHSIVVNFRSNNPTIKEGFLAGEKINIYPLNDGHWYRKAAHLLKLAHQFGMEDVCGNIVDVIEQYTGASVNPCDMPEKWPHFDIEYDVEENFTEVVKDKESITDFLFDPKNCLEDIVSYD